MFTYNKSTGILNLPIMTTTSAGWLAVKIEEATGHSFDLSMTDSPSHSYIDIIDRVTPSEAKTIYMLWKMQGIAERDLGVETLTTRNSDSLDFHDLSVGNIETALRHAFEAGLNAASNRSLK